MLVNPWNICKVAVPIGMVMDITVQEREDNRHHNIDHVTIHIA